MFKVISFYKYVDVKRPSVLRDEVRAFCSANDILGRIMVGKEGLNGGVCGSVQKIEKFKCWVKSYKDFDDLTFREQDFEKNTYHKLIVRVRSEICAFGKDVDLSKKGEYVSPAELERMYCANEDFVIVDARNTYEFDVGHFNDAVRLPIENFREFADVAVKKLDKDKKIVLYCTGGIRCEKASAFLKQENFSDVSHLQGGIINYVNQFPNSKWEGGLFVFDDRLVSDVGSAISNCVYCGNSTSGMLDCHNLACDKLFVICSDCSLKTKNCSVDCSSGEQRKVVRNEKVVGKVLNYYSRKGVASVKGVMVEGCKVRIRGKTTDFEQVIDSLRVDSENVFSFPVSEKCRENDLVYVEV